MIDRAQLEKKAGRWRLKLPIEQVPPWQVGQVVEAQGRKRKELLYYRVADWYPTEEGMDEWQGKDEWVVWLVRIAKPDVPIFLTPAARPAGTVLGYTSQKAVAMPGEPEVVPKDWQDRIGIKAEAVRTEMAQRAQREREKQPWAVRLEAAKAKAKEKRAGKLLRAELRTVEILGQGDRRRARAMLGKLEKRLFR